jgi:catechol 2,3-dioxygenase-like lactoylglutathione lyase family enzyme
MQDVPADKEITMDFVSIRIITDDVARLAGFYERATGVQAAWPNENFAELTTSSATLAVASTRTVPLFAPGAARPADNNTVIIEFLVDDVDGVHQNLAGFVEDFVNEPTTMPWGNRSLLFRDPDGNLVNFFTPVTPAAIDKFARWRSRGRRNLAIVDEVQAIAAEAGATPAQIALAWLLAQGDDIAPIPGIRRVARVEQNTAADGIELNDDQLERLNNLTPAVCERHDEANMASIDRWPRLVRWRWPSARSTYGHLARGPPPGQLTPRRAGGRSRATPIAVITLSDVQGRGERAPSRRSGRFLFKVGQARDHADKGDLRGCCLVAWAGKQDPDFCTSSACCASACRLLCASPGPDLRAVSRHHGFQAASCILHLKSAVDWVRTDLRQALFSQFKGTFAWAARLSRYPGERPGLAGRPGLVQDQHNRQHEQRQAMAGMCGVRHAGTWPISSADSAFGRSLAVLAHAGDAVCSAVWSM